MFNWGPINFQDFANGALIIVIGLVSALGIRGGTKAAKKTAAEPETETLALAGAVIDSKKADELVNAFKANTLAVKRLEGTLDRHTAAVVRHGNQMDALRDDTVDLKAGINTLTNEVIRSSGKN